MKFTKMHGIGNDYVYVNCFKETVEKPEEAARFVSDRHFGIGSDGLILIKPSPVADCEMEMYNLDGSRGAMCGNGIRCVAKYAYDYGIVDRTHITVATGAGIKTLDLTLGKDGKVAAVRVNMGAPELSPAKIPVLKEKNSSASGKSNTASGEASEDTFINQPVEVDGTVYYMTAVSMGNPHSVIFMDDVDSLPLEQMGPSFEHHPVFPDRVNTEFIKILDRHTIKMRVWERGSGETLACGTGACAAAVASILNGHVDQDAPVTVKLLGGDLQIEWDQKEGSVYMTGPAATVFDGEIDLSFL